MLFNSYAFLLGFLPASLLIYRLADNYALYRTWILVALSLVFYSYWNVRFLPLMIGSILINWWAARIFVATRNAAVTNWAIVANLVTLGLFKYLDFATANIGWLLGLQIQPLGIALPLGISFFTFHHIMYLVDLRRGQAPAYPLDRYALYICFFPQAIAGPIARWNEVIDQFGQKVFQPGWEKRFAAGILLVVIGLFEKAVIADTLGEAVDPIFRQALHGPVPDGRSWMSFAWAFQVFFDFAGYSDIAIGLGLMFGIVLPRNFNAPFRAIGIQDFWRRWHMTLTRFLRDYLYIPLGGNRYGPSRQYAAIVITMGLCGLWHGASWNPVLWGFLQGAGLAFSVLWSRLGLRSPPALVGWAAAVGFFVATIVVFRAGSLEAAWHIYQGLATAPISWHPEGRNAFIVAIICAVFLPPTHEICERLTRSPNRFTAALIAAAAVLLLAVIGDRENYQFIYFQF